jgi:hypothetical protein
VAGAGPSAWHLLLREHFALDLVSSPRYTLSSSLTFSMPPGDVMESLPESATVFSRAAFSE